MRPAPLVVCLLLTACCAMAAEGPPVRPFEADDWSIPVNGVDLRVLAALERAGLQPARPCSDEVFLRRVYLDLIGTLPEPADARRFLQDTSPNKRAALIDALLQRPEFADYWTLKWGDLLRVKAEFPIDLWPNAVQAYHRWIHEALRKGRPYDWFVRELLTSSGSNFRVPPVNFYRAIQGRTPQARAEAVALTFMGTRLATWPAQARADMAAFFSRVAYKSTGEWKEEIVSLDLGQTTPLDVTFPDGTKATVAAGQDPRVVFADWLIRPQNPWFARNIVNRIWSWLLGRGIIHEPDDIRPDNPPANPELLAYLEQELVAARYDLRAVFRLIANSRTYQQSSIPRSEGAQAEALCAFYPVRRLDAEVLADALDWVSGTGQTYMSPIPEPFTYLPSNQRAIGIPDGSITSTFLVMYGRPARDTGLESERSNQVTDAQRLYLLNSSDIQKRIARSPRLRAALAAAGADRAASIRAVYFTLLARDPTPEEQTTAATYWQTPGLGPDNAATDLAWALINSAEFLYRH